jgi:hypothetical protein
MPCSFDLWTLSIQWRLALSGLIVCHKPIPTGKSIVVCALRRCLFGGSDHESNFCFCNASFTLLPFLRDRKEISGAKSLGLQPAIHDECQNFVLFPSPIVIVVVAANSSLSISLQEFLVLSQSFSCE